MDQGQDKAFVRKLAKMDAKAWEVFCREYSGALVTFVWKSFGCSRQVAEEVVQMTFVRCVKSIGTYKPSRGSLFGWLKAISKNEAHTILRRGQVQYSVPLPSGMQSIAGEILEKVDSAPLPDEILARKEFQLLINDALAGLASSYRKVLIMKYLEGRRVSEIAVALGQSEKAIESLLSRSRDAFRKVLSTKLKRGEKEEGESPK